MLYTDTGAASVLWVEYGNKNAGSAPAFYNEKNVAHRTGNAKIAKGFTFFKYCNDILVKLTL